MKPNWLQLVILAEKNQVVFVFVYVCFIALKGLSFWNLIIIIIIILLFLLLILLSLL